MRYNLYFNLDKIELIFSNCCSISSVRIYTHISSARMCAVCMCVHVFVRACTHTCLHAYMHAYAPVHVCICVWIISAPNVPFSFITSSWPCTSTNLMEVMVVGFKNYITIAFYLLSETCILHGLRCHLP